MGTVCSLSVHRKGQQEVEDRIGQLSALDEETDNWLALRSPMTLSGPHVPALIFDARAIFTQKCA